VWDVVADYLRDRQLVRISTADHPVIVD